ncbi:MAG: hypothetical protein ACLP8S_25225, partial [Solirubrobacteraceae bacterium]
MSNGSGERGRHGIAGSTVAINGDADLTVEAPGSMRRVGPLEEMGWAQGSGLAACAVVRGGEGLFAPRGGVREVEQA